MVIFKLCSQSRSCVNLQRPMAAQLLDHPFIKKVKRDVSLKDHKHLLDRSRKNKKKHKEKNVPTVKRYLCFHFAPHLVIPSINTCFSNHDLPIVTWNLENEVCTLYLN